MSKLLHFLVDYKLSETDQALTAYTVAVDALGRDDDFDPQTDSYPRVQIGRLRRMLDHFYMQKNSGSRLSIPLNNYEIILGANDLYAGDGEDASDSKMDGAKSEKPRIDKSKPAFSRFFSPVPGIFTALLVLAGLIILAMTFAGRRSGESAEIIYPAVVVTASDSIGNPASQAMVEIVRSHLISSLGKFDHIRIFDQTAPPETPAQYLLETSIFNGAADQMQLRLLDSQTREVVWSERITLDSSEKFKSELDQAVITIASAYGRIELHELSKYKDDYSAGYPCILQFRLYVRFRDDEIRDAVLKCLAAAYRRYPNDAYLMSLLPRAKNVAMQFDDKETADVFGQDSAEIANKLDHNSASTIFAVAQTAYYEGDCDRGLAWGERAIRRNPLDSTIMGYLGAYMLACGNSEGGDYAERALRMDPNVDMIVPATLAIMKIQRGDPQGAQQLALQYLQTAPKSTPGLEIAYIISTAELGQKADALEAWQKLVARSGLPENASPRQVLGRWIANPDMVRELQTYLAETGLLAGEQG